MNGLFLLNSVRTGNRTFFETQTNSSHAHLSILDASDVEADAA
jgi:hypothetical protein